MSEELNTNKYQVIENIINDVTKKRKFLSYLLQQTQELSKNETNENKTKINNYRFYANWIEYCGAETIYDDSNMPHLIPSETGIGNGLSIEDAFSGTMNNFNYRAEYRENLEHEVLKEIKKISSQIEEQEIIKLSVTLYSDEIANLENEHLIQINNFLQYLFDLAQKITSSVKLELCECSKLLKTIKEFLDQGNKKFDKSNDVFNLISSCHKYVKSEVEKILKSESNLHKKIDNIRLIVFYIKTLANLSIERDLLSKNTIINLYVNCKDFGNMNITSDKITSIINIYLIDFENSDFKFQKKNESTSAVLSKISILINDLEKEIDETKYADMKRSIEINNEKKGKAIGDGSCFIHSVMAHMTQKEFEQVKKYVDENDKTCLYNEGIGNFLESVRTLRKNDSEQICYMRAAIALKMDANSNSKDKDIDNEIKTVLGKNVEIKIGDGTSKNSNGWVGFNQQIVTAVSNLLKRPVLVVSPGSDSHKSGYIYTNNNDKTLASGYYSFDMIEIKNIESVNKCIKKIIDSYEKNRCICIHFNGSDHFNPIGKNNMNDNYKFKPTILPVGDKFATKEQRENSIKFLNSFEQKYGEQKFTQKFLNDPDNIKIMSIFYESIAENDISDTEIYLQKFILNNKLDIKKLQEFANIIKKYKNLTPLLKKSPTIIFVLVDYYESDNFSRFVNRMLFISNKYFIDGFLDEFWHAFYKLDENQRVKIFKLLNRENTKYIFPTIYHVITKNRLYYIDELTEKFSKTVINYNKKLTDNFCSYIGIKRKWFTNRVDVLERDYPKLSKFISLFDIRSMKFFSDVIKKSKDLNILLPLCNISFSAISGILGKLFICLDSLKVKFCDSEIYYIKDTVLNVFVDCLKKLPFEFEKLSQTINLIAMPEFVSILQNSDCLTAYFQNPTDFINKFNKTRANLEKIQDKLDISQDKIEEISVDLWDQNNEVSRMIFTFYLQSITNIDIKKYLAIKISESLQKLQDNQENTPAILTKQNITK